MIHSCSILCYIFKLVFAFALSPPALKSLQRTHGISAICNSVLAVFNECTASQIEVFMPLPLSFGSPFAAAPVAAEDPAVLAQVATAAFLVTSFSSSHSKVLKRAVQFFAQVARSCIDAFGFRKSRWYSLNSSADATSNSSSPSCLHEDRVTSPAYLLQGGPSPRLRRPLEEATSSPSAAGPPDSIVPKRSTKSSNFSSASMSVDKTACTVSERVLTFFCHDSNDGFDARGWASKAFKTFP